jgi:hypothetical protein
MRSTSFLLAVLLFCPSCHRHPSRFPSDLRERARAEAVRFVKMEFGREAKIDVSRTPDARRTARGDRWRVEILLGEDLPGEIWSLVLLLDAAGETVLEAAYRVERELFWDWRDEEKWLRKQARRRD